MGTELNPYRAPIDVSPNGTRLSIDELVSSSVSIAGLFLATAASIGSVARCVIEVDTLQIWYGDSLSPTLVGLLAIGALGIATWLLVALMSNIDRFVPSDYVMFSKTMLLIASVSMIARLISEPSTDWTPTWPSYLLTFAGTMSLGMVAYQIRAELYGSKE